MPFDITYLLLDFALISLLLFIGKILRIKVKLIQNLFLPAPLIAGFLGLFLGPYFLDILPFSSYVNTYPGLLISLLFAGLFIGRQERTSFKQMVHKVGDTFSLNLAAEVGQFMLALLLGTFLIGLLFPDVHKGFSLLLPAGFVGGHGYAAAIGGTFQDVGGWDEAISIGQTFATAGMLVGIIGGVIMINIGIKKGYTSFVKEMHSLPESMRTGLVPVEERKVLGQGTTHSMSLDPFTWHVMLILIATGIGYFLDYLLSLAFPQISFPIASLTMIGGVLVQLLMNLLKLHTYVDDQVITHMGSSITDYLVAFGIASINVSVIIDYAVPLLLMIIIGILFSVTYVMVICKKLYRAYWFEKGMFIFGWMTGVMAIGVTLLRIVDPNFKTDTLKDYGVAYIFISFIELAIVSITPLAVLGGYAYLLGSILLVIFIALLLYARKLKHAKS